MLKASSNENIVPMAICGRCVEHISHRLLAFSGAWHAQEGPRIIRTGTSISDTYQVVPLVKCHLAKSSRCTRAGVLKVLATGKSGVLEHEGTRSTSRREGDERVFMYHSRQEDAPTSSEQLSNVQLVRSVNSVQKFQLLPLKEKHASTRKLSGSFYHMDHAASPCRGIIAPKGLSLAGQAESARSTVTGGLVGRPPTQLRKCLLKPASVTKCRTAGVCICMGEDCPLKAFAVAAHHAG